MPPARGIIAASSEQQSAPVIVITPATVQARISQPGAPVRRDDSADARKIPEPIIEPTTIIVASSGPRRRTNPCSSWFASEFGMKRKIKLVGGDSVESAVAGIGDPGLRKSGAMRAGITDPGYNVQSRPLVAPSGYNRGGTRAAISTSSSS